MLVEGYIFVGLTPMAPTWVRLQRTDQICDDTNLRWVSLCPSQTLAKDKCTNIKQMRLKYVQKTNTNRRNIHKTKDALPETTAP